MGAVYVVELILSLWFSRWDSILTTTYESLAFLPICQAFLVENRMFTVLLPQNNKYINIIHYINMHLYTINLPPLFSHCSAIIPLGPTLFTWALMDKCSLCLFLRIHWLVLAFHGTHDRSILSATGRWCVLSPSVTQRVTSIPVARAASRCGTSAIQETRPLCPSWTALWACYSDITHATPM